MLKTGVEVRFEPKLHNNRVMVAIYVSINSIKAFENLADETRKCLWKRYAFNVKVRMINT